jgi:hypothetical protein
MQTRIETFGGFKYTAVISTTDALICPTFSQSERL